MPVYTYRCENCGVQFERTQKFTEPHLAWCPECGKKTLRKVFTPVGIVFKGSGFYATDHRSPSGAPRLHEKHGEGKPASEGESSGSTGSSGSESSSTGSESSSASSSTEKASKPAESSSD